ncbi:MAG TPA: transglutaminase family protein [Roseimicrobium sp.]|nr:transglutaminase family protein [Roseimicrobium sp.]
MKQPTLLQQGRLADTKLAALGLTLTQGGEPTFVPANTLAREWNTGALGPEKLLFARRFCRQLARTMLPGAVILQSFGKQFPGEPLPRWTLGLYRSKTGEPFWKDLDRIKLDETPSLPDDPGLARRIAAGIADALFSGSTSAVAGKEMLPAYEDVEAWMRFEETNGKSAPLPRFSKSSAEFVLPRKWTAEEEAHWQKYCCIKGWVLPLGHIDGNWVSANWVLPEGEDLTLLIGNSPIGLRLPLNRFAPDVIRTALTVEIKDGDIVLFAPPLPTAAAFGELMRAIESVSEKLKLQPIVIEGYRPPGDPDLESFAMMADPGVIEVNLPPAADWPELDKMVRSMYTAAQAVGLRGFKFHYTGRKVGTGGGAHIILGGPNLDTNPFILRPTMLSSMLRFLQHHPSLSYMFTGLFVGPSSQAPRVDETMYEVPYELELALKTLERMPSPGDPRLIDGLLRNLLLDWNGNTHRAELSVDKFFYPFSPNGCLGLVEFRAFEMPPTPDMHLAMHLLLRALATTFAERPYTKPLIHWKESLHDKYALPWYLAQDLQQVLRHLKKHGFHFRWEWFQPLLDFRFPVVTQFETGVAKWTLRQALEPWPVMGEQPVGGGTTARLVDASTDRLQLEVQARQGLSNLGVAINGIKLPLQRQAGGTALCGVRYRLFDNPNGLQPQVPAHSPLVFEIFDTRTGLIRHAFQYLNWRPQPGEYDGHPRNDSEARARVVERLHLLPERFEQPVQYREVELSPDAPHTLDLRSVV